MASVEFICHVLGGLRPLLEPGQQYRPQNPKKRVKSQARAHIKISLAKLTGEVCVSSSLTTVSQNRKYRIAVTKIFEKYYKYFSQKNTRILLSYNKLV